MGCEGGGQAPCSYDGTRYTAGRDFLNGVNTLDFANAEIERTGGNFSAQAVIFDEAYAPTLLAPLQLRTLQSVWWVSQPRAAVAFSSYLVTDET